MLKREPVFTVLLATTREPFFLPFVVKSILAQTVEAFELCIVADGAPKETIEFARELAQGDPRVKVFAFSKGLRIGEAHWHKVLETASGRYVAHIEDDDLWLPNHLDELEKLLQTCDFGHTIHVWGHPDGHVEPLALDLEMPDLRRRLLCEMFNRIGFSVCGYRLDAYRSLPEGWAPSPEGTWPDLHMWRKFLRTKEFTFRTRMAITAIVLPTHLWGSTPIGERISGTLGWLDRILNEQERAKIVEAAWHSIVRESLQREQQEMKLKESHDQITAQLGRMSKSRDQFQAMLMRVTEIRDELRAERDRIIHSRSWRLTKPLRTLLAAIKPHWPNV